MKNHRDHYTENCENDLERTRKELQAFVVSVVRARMRESRRQRKKEKERESTGIAGNKQLANPRRQFNLAANPRENVNKDLATTSATLLRSAASRGTRVLARATTLYFRAKIPPPASPDHVEIVCKASCVRCPFLFSRLPPLLLSLLFCYPFRPSTLVIYRGYAADTHGGICITGE